MEWCNGLWWCIRWSGVIVCGDGGDGALDGVV